MQVPPISWLPLWMVTFIGAQFGRTLSRFGGTAPHVIQTLCAAPMIIASLIDLFCIRAHGRGPSDSSARQLERDHLLDLLRRHVCPTLLKQFHVSIRITSGTELVDALRTQPRPVNAWITTEPFWIGIQTMSFFIGIGTLPDIG